MKNLLLLLLIPLISACASQATTSQTSPHGLPGSATPAIELVTLSQATPRVIELEVAGIRYVGSWTDGPCFTDFCRGDFRNVPRMYRRHVRHGEAELAASNGTRMNCLWVSYRDQIRGSCRTAEGQDYVLEYQPS